MGLGWFGTICHPHPTINRDADGRCGSSTIVYINIYLYGYICICVYLCVCRNAVKDNLRSYNAFVNSVGSCPNVSSQFVEQRLGLQWLQRMNGSMGGRATDRADSLCFWSYASIHYSPPLYNFSPSPF